MSSKKWFPLEANPDVMNEYAHQLGLAESAGVTFTDVFGLDDDLLSMLPQPVLAFLLLYPITSQNEALGGGPSSSSSSSASSQAAAPLFYTKQTISNACGTIGILHALLNIPHARSKDEEGKSSSLLFRSGSVLDTFDKTIGASTTATPEERAQAIEQQDALDAAQADAAQHGVTENQDIDADIMLHFVCILPYGSGIVELDGRKSGPWLIPADDTDSVAGAEGFPQQAAKHIRRYMELNPEEVQFNVVALVGGSADDGGCDE